LFAARAELSDAQTRERLAHRLFEVARLVDLQPNEENPPLGVFREQQNPAHDLWNAQVNAAVGLLRAEELEKVVLARELVLECEAPLDVAMILRRLLGRNDGSVCFAFRNGGSTFLGSTPERLVSRCGHRISTEALAGSAAADDPAAVEALVHGDKDRREHSIVVRDIVSRLQAMGAQVTTPAAPELRHFGPIVHLRTVIEATRLDAPHVLALGYHLHPTPAVAGIPTQRALEFIRMNEPFQRGRYAGPTGWFDLHGDGELVVALRSGLVRNREIRLFAGAGLVNGSEPNAEWRETEIKFRSLLDALGVYRGPMPSPATPVEP
jgi:menaquinone-specific isochorismate synthase